ncbi:MAG: DUF1566 domain-containing protein [Methylovulum sp.]|nr:MAG: DUF1566 domain-containing protein [Methylovulum sp.]
MFKMNRPFTALAVSLGLLAFLPTAPAADRYTVSANGQEVKDNKTQLVWRRCPEGMSWSVNTCAGSASYLTHQAALQQATSEAAGTGVAWRLPNVKELASIVDRSRSYPAIDTLTFPATPSSAFWSSSPDVGYADGAWSVDFSDGGVDYGGRGSSFAVRLVRASQ